MKKTAKKNKVFRTLICQIRINGKITQIESNGQAAGIKNKRQKGDHLPFSVGKPTFIQKQKGDASDGA